MKNSFKNLSYAELVTKRNELKKKYMELRFKIVLGNIDNPLQKRIMRRQIARLNTLIGEHDRNAAALSKSENSAMGAK